MKRTMAKEIPKRPWVMWAIWSKAYGRWQPVGMRWPVDLYPTERRARAHCLKALGEVPVRVICRPEF